MQEASRHGTVEYWELNWKCYGYCHLPTHTSNPAWAKWPQRNTQCTNKYKKKIQHMLFERNYFAIQQFSSRVYVQQCIDEERQGGRWMRESKGISRWVGMDDGDCILARWAAVRLFHSHWFFAQLPTPADLQKILIGYVFCFSLLPNQSMW